MDPSTYMYPPHTERDLVKTGAIQTLALLADILDKAKTAVANENPQPPADTLERVVERLEDSIGRVSIVNGQVRF